MLSLWALLRKSAAAGAAALWAVAIALAAREWVGGSVTLASAKIRVPLLHDPALVHSGAVEVRVVDGRAEEVSAAGELPRGGKTAASRAGGSGRDEGAYDGGSGRKRAVGGEGGGAVPGSLVGAKVEIVEVTGSGQSGFDRLCIKVQVSTAVGTVGIAIELSIVVDLLYVLYSLNLPCATIAQL